MIDIKLSEKEKPIARREYVKLLEEHFELTIPFRKLYLDERLPPIEKSILAYKEKYVITHPNIVFATIICFGLVSSLAMGTIIIWIINEVIQYPVNYTAKNILAMSSVFIIGKAKLHFFRGS